MRWHSLRIEMGMETTNSAESLNRLTSIVVQAAIRIHRALGPGLLEGAYLPCVCFELADAGVTFERQVPIPLVYKGTKIDCAYRADIVIERSVIVEVKAVEFLMPIHARQLYTYLRLANCPVGLILNFGAATMKDGIKRVVNGFPE